MQLAVNHMNMKKIAISLLLWIVAASTFLIQSSAQEPSYDQPWRPQYHFTPPKNFMNDPNGTVFYRGEYHLFYQYNPEDRVWGHMHWGHAVSPDMVHWQNLPIALREEPGKYMAFSGSSVEDRENSSGLCKNPDPSDRSCMIAINTAHSKGHHRQNLAYSNDRGRTWTNYADNPVSDLGLRDFRDPNVFWYEPQHKWVMIAVLANEKSVVILDSPDLKNWTRRSTFGPAGENKGVWECPDLFELAVEGTNEKKWVLIVSRSAGAPFEGTGVQYIVGKFDGATFTSEVPDTPELWADWGKDFYAANTWNDAPVSPGQRVWIGWFDNWQYANFEPSLPWRGVQTIPRTLALRRYADGLHLVQRPVSQLHSLRQQIFRIKNARVVDANQKIYKSGTRGDVYELEAELAPGQAQEIGVRVRIGDHTETVVGFDPAKHEVSIDRTHSGEVSFSKDFSGRHAAQLEKNTSVKLHIFVDRSSFELFANDGERVISDRIYPPPGSEGIEVYEKGSGGKVVSLTVWKLNSVWQ